MFRQKSRMDWIDLSDGNTKFFHQAIQRRIFKSSIKKNLFEGRWISDSNEIREAFYIYYSQFFKNNHSELLGLGSLVLSSLSSSSKSFLVSYISEQEMEIALHDLSDNKAPGPDGMNIKSLKFLWPFIKDKMSGFIGNFCNSCTLPPGVNSFFIALVPKIPNLVTIKDFRPISLINSSIKVLLKILTSRLATQMSTLVADNQTGFFKGRKAAESILVAKEVAHSILSKKKHRGFILKLDFEKAFDSVNWKFLDSTLLRMNFDNQWCAWIKAILESIRISILVNGIPTKKFSPSRGLRQGDPISPLLFNLVGKVLSTLFKTAASKGFFKGISLSKGQDCFTHLQFADDTIMFINGSLESVIGIKRVLQCFQLLSGLKINYKKSELFSSKSCKAEALEASSLFGCRVGVWPMKYLGMPVGASSRRRVF